MLIYRHLDCWNQLSAQLQIIILYLLLSFYIPSLPTA